MAFRAELDEGPEPRSSSSQHGDTLSFPPGIQRGDTLRFPSSPEIGSSLAPSSGVRASDHDLEAGRLSAIVSTASTTHRPAIHELPPLGERERKVSEVIADRYVLESEIAQGGMGVVWRAYDRERAQHVAVKLVAPHLLVDGDAAARLCAEATLLMLIDSPHVARILDAGTMPDGGPFMVTELLRGVTLQQLVAANPSIPVREAVGWICQAASGLADVHQVGLVHDDLKPSNLFLSEVDGERASIKLLDFGVARILSDPQTLSTRGEVFGNPCYMAPERIAGSWYADHRADIWSLGVALYELMTGQRPFDGDTLDDVCAAVTAASPRPLRELRPEVSPELEQAVRRCLQPRPEDRYSNARLLLIDLKRSLASSPSTVSTPIRREPQPDASELADSAPVPQSNCLALVNDAPLAQSDASATQSHERRFEDSATSIRATKLRSIVQAPAFQPPRPAQQRFVAAKQRDETTSAEAPIRRRRRWPAVIAYAIAIGFVSLVGILGAARALRLGHAPVTSAPAPELAQPFNAPPPVHEDAPNAARPPMDGTPSAQRQDQPQAMLEPVAPASAIAEPDASKDDAPAARPGEPTTIVLPTSPAETSSVPQPNAGKATTPHVAANAKPSGGWHSRTNARTYDTSPPRGTPLDEVHINAQGELTDAKGRPLPNVGDQK